MTGEYINDSFDNLSSYSKLFTDVTLLLSVVKNHIQSGIDLNTDLRKISAWMFQREMNLKPDPTKQAQK